MNIGYEDEGELKPYVEPPKDQIDEARIEKLIQVNRTDESYNKKNNYRTKFSSASTKEVYWTPWRRRSSKISTLHTCCWENGSAR